MTPKQQATALAESLALAALAGTMCDFHKREAKGHPLYHKRPLASRDCSPHELSTQPAMAYSIKGKHDMVGNSAVSAISPVAMFSYYGCYRSVTPKDSLIY